ncbi:MAG: portal protein, partial [Candidatus Izemoplasmatales bacterium]
YANGIVVHNSILDSSRKLWKQLQLAEDAMLVYRVTRAPDRRVFYIEAGNLPDGDIKQYVGKIQNQVRKQPMVDARTGNMTQKYDPENVTEDYWIPIRGDKSSKIETLPGPTNLGDIQDIEYFQNKLFAALQVPKTYLNYAESMPGGSTLSQADIRFSRTINSIQEAILLELRRVANVHLYFLGFEDDLDNFQLTLTNPSTQQELLKLETMKARLEVFKEFFNTDANAPTSYTWAMENVLGFSKSDIKLILKQKKVEKKIFAEIDSAVETYKKIGLFDELDERYEDPEAAQLATGGGKPEGDESGEGSDVSSGGGFGGLSGFGNEFGGGEEMGGEDLGSQEAGGEEGGEEAPPLSESKLTKVMAASDKRANVLISELLGQESEKKELIKEVEEKDNALVKKNKFINLKTKKLIESIENNLGKVKVIEEKKEKKSADLLFEKNKKNNKKTKEIFDKLDEITEE